MTTSFPRPFSVRRWAFALWAALGLASAWAQTDPNLDPPGRVGRVDLIEGSMSVAPQGSSAWVGVVPNRPLTSGDRLWTAERTRAEVHLGAHAARVGSATDLKLLTLDDEVTHVQLTQGTLSLRVRQLFDGQSVQIDTPNLGFSVGQPGEYRIDVDPLRNATRIAVASGSGVAYGEGGQTVPLGNRQQLSFGGTALALLASQEVGQRDGFDTWAADRDRAEDQSTSARYVSREVVGYQQLDQYGDWSSDAALGPVWYPRAVAVDWAPYRAGHWEFIVPWGWTWVDDAPWGFAPFHYGRWAYVGARWAWVPGPLTPRPVYAPALVVFVGGNAGPSYGPARQPGVAWFPLAPGEPWRPGYRTSQRYVSRANPGVYSNQFDDRSGYRHQQMPRAVTAVSADNFSQGRPVQNDPYRARSDEFRRAPTQATPNVAPDPRTPFLGQRPAPSLALPPASLSQQDALTRRAAAERAANPNDGGRQRGPGQDEGRFNRHADRSVDGGRAPPPGPAFPGVQTLPAQQFPAPAVQAPALPMLRQPPPSVQSTELPPGRTVVNPTLRQPPMDNRAAEAEAQRQQRLVQQQQREQEMRAQQAQQRAQADAQARAQAEAQARGQAEAQARAQMEAQARANAQAQQAQAQAAAEAQARAQAQQRAAPPVDAGRPVRPGSPLRQPNEAKDGRNGGGNNGDDDNRRGRWQGQPR